MCSLWSSTLGGLIPVRPDFVLQSRLSTKRWYLFYRECDGFVNGKSSEKSSEKSSKPCWQVWGLVYKDRIWLHQHSHLSSSTTVCSSSHTSIFMLKPNWFFEQCDAIILHFIMFGEKMQIKDFHIISLLSLFWSLISLLHLSRFRNLFIVSMPTLNGWRKFSKVKKKSRFSKMHGRKQIKSGNKKFNFYDYDKSNLNQHEE